MCPAFSLHDYQMLYCLIDGSSLHRSHLNHNIRYHFSRSFVIWMEDTLLVCPIKIFLLEMLKNKKRIPCRFKRYLWGCRVLYLKPRNTLPPIGHAAIFKLLSSQKTDPDSQNLCFIYIFFPTACLSKCSALPLREDRTELRPPSYLGCEQALLFSWT